MATRDFATLGAQRDKPGMAAGGTAMVVGDSGGECSGTEEQRVGLLDGFAFSQFEWR